MLPRNGPLTSTDAAIGSTAKRKPQKKESDAFGTRRAISIWLNSPLLRECSKQQPRRLKARHRRQARSEQLAIWRARHSPPRSYPEPTQRSQPSPSHNHPRDGSDEALSKEFGEKRTRGAAAIRSDQKKGVVGDEGVEEWGGGYEFIGPTTRFLVPSCRNWPLQYFVPILLASRPGDETNTAPASRLRPEACSSWSSHGASRA